MVDFSFIMALPHSVCGKLARADFSGSTVDHRHNGPISLITNIRNCRETFKRNLSPQPIEFLLTSRYARSNPRSSAQCKPPVLKQRRTSLSKISALICAASYLASHKFLSANTLVATVNWAVPIGRGFETSAELPTARKPLTVATRSIDGRRQSLHPPQACPTIVL